MNDSDANQLKELLSPLFGQEDATLVMMYPLGNLRLYVSAPNTDRGFHSRAVGDRELCKAVWELVGKPRDGFGVQGRRLLPLMRKQGSTLEVVKRLNWWTPYSLDRSFE